jgi:hypothetical protein
MKTLRQYATRYRCTLARAAREIVTLNTARAARCPNGAGVATMAPVSPEQSKAGLKRRAAAYLDRKARQRAAFGLADKGITF